MFSEKAKKISDNCRFCWMCRYICPIGQVTGKEANNARAKGLLVSFANRGHEFDESYAQAMYECAICGGCTHDCATGFEPPIFIREARTEAVVKNIVPANVRPLIDNIDAEGNIFGVSAKELYTKARQLLPDAKEKANILFYIGATALVKTPEIVKSVGSLLNKAGLDFEILSDEGQSGAEQGDLIGYVAETVESAKKTAEKINATGAEKVVVLDPNCTKVMKQQYPIWGCELQADVVTATSFFAGLIEAGKLSPSKSFIEDVTYHDPCKLSRDLDETQPARDILAAMGVETKEMLLNYKLTKCCGTEILRQHSPSVVALTSDSRWGDAQRIRAKTMVTSCPGCFDVFALRVPKGMEIIDLFVLLDKSC